MQGSWIPLEFLQKVMATILGGATLPTLALEMWAGVSITFL